MKKFCLALLVLAFSMPAIAGVTITIEKAPLPDVNAVLIKYVATEEVRAFAVDVTVTDSALKTSRTLRQGLTRPAVDDANYYVTPTNASFGDVGSPATYRLWNYGSPIAAADGNGCTIEMASLYANNDPCVAHRFAPPLEGTLVKLFVDQTKRGADNAITVTVTGANAKRGGIVLKSGSTVAPTGLPASVVFQYDCMEVGEWKGGNWITNEIKSNWITAGNPSSWCHPGHFMGDSNIDCLIDATDIIDDAVGIVPAFGSAFGDDAYRPGCDYNDDLYVDASDILGWTFDAQNNPLNGLLYGWGVGTVPAPCDPGTLP